MLRNKSLRPSGGDSDAVVKGLADGSLTSFKASDYGLTSLTDRRFENFTSLESLDLTGITTIPQYTAYQCTGLKNLTLDTNVSNIANAAFATCTNTDFRPILRFNNAMSIGNSAFTQVRIKELEGTFSSIGDYSFGSANSQETSTIHLEKLHVKVNGHIGNYAFQYRNYVEDFYLDPSSNITSLGSYTFYNLGARRTNPQSNIFTFDFRNSSFETVQSYCFSGSNTSNKSYYYNIYFPSSLTKLVNNSLSYSDYYNIYYKKIPTLDSVNVFMGTTNYKNFFPYNLVQTAKTATNWSSNNNGINASIYGYSDVNEFLLGDTLPETDENGYALTWYSDEAMTTQVTVVSDPTKMYYCSVGSQIKTKLNIAQYQVNLNITDGTNNYSNGDLIPIGTALTITAITDGINEIPYIFKLNGDNITSGDSYIVNNDTINIACCYYDGLSKPFEEIFNLNTPAQIKVAVDNGFHRIIWTVGDTITITLTDNTSMGIRYTDGKLNRYEKSSGGSYSNAVFEFTNCINGTYQMNSTSTNIDGWGTSKMNIVTMATIYDLLPSDWKSIISEVKIPYCATYNSNVLSYVNDKLFLPAASEIFNTYSYAQYEGDIYERYNGLSSSNIIKKSYNDVSAVAWWLRSVYKSNSSNFCNVGTTGTLNYTYNASLYYYVSPCFAV